jgi:Xaa-Pro aminopeptidase
LALLIVVVCGTSPAYSPQSVARPGRLDRLAEQGHLDAPVLVIGADNNLYLSGRATALAVVAADDRLHHRLLLPLLGRSPHRPIRRLRAVKDEGELAAMRRAALITSSAFADIEPMIRPGVSEAEIDRAIRASFARHGADGIAFDSVVASGANAVLPHYQRNDAVMERGLVVIDIGCSVGGYASDMTRSFPVRGEASQAEQKLLEVAAAAHRAAAAELRAGASMSELDEIARKVIADAGFAGFMNHGLGHHVGLSVHDPHVDRLEAGMVVTIEPGLYIARGAPVDPAFWDLGVRIEDSYLVTDDGCEALTSYHW